MFKNCICIVNGGSKQPKIMDFAVEDMEKQKYAHDNLPEGYKTTNGIDFFPREFWMEILDTKESKVKMIKSRKKINQAAA